MKGIIRRDGKYVARPTASGRKHWLGTFNTEEEAEAAIVKWRERGHVGVERITVKQIADIFEDQRFPHIAPATQGNYRRALETFCREFGRREPKTIRRIEVQTWAADQPRDNLFTARTMFQWALSMDLISDDPTRGVVARRAQRKHKPHVLSQAEVAALAETSFDCWDDPEAEVLAAFIRFAAASGMRPGEIAALRWSGIDYAVSEITVSASISEGGEKSPKNGEERTIVLTPEARAALATLPSATPQDRIFELPDGQLLVKATLHRYWDRVRIAAGLPGYRLYDLRHTCATNLLMAGLPSYVVAAQLGHKDGGRLVESTYGHPSHADALAKIKDATRVAPEYESPRLRVAGGVASGGRIA